MIGTAVGLIVAYFCKSSADDPDNDAESFPEDEDFDLDADLKPTGREYVSLKKENSDRSESTENVPDDPDVKDSVDENAADGTDASEES